MPHHGSFEDDSFRWTFYVTKHSYRLLASVICEDPFVSTYQSLQTGIRDFPWPMSMRNNYIQNNFLYYWSIDPSKIGKKNKQGQSENRYDLHKKKTNAALFMTGAEPCRCVYFKIQNSQLYKYDSTKKDFIWLNGENIEVNEVDNDEIINSTTVLNNETTTGEMQMRNTPMNGGGFGMNGSAQKMEEDEPTTQNSSSSRPSLSPIKKMEFSSHTLNPKIEGHPLFSTKDQSESQGNQHILMEIAEQNEMQEVNPSDNITFGWNAHDQEGKMQTRNSFSLQTKEDSSVINDPTQQSSLSGPNSKQKKQQAKKPNTRRKNQKTKHIPTKPIKHGYGTPSEM